MTSDSVISKQGVKVNSVTVTIGCNSSVVGKQKVLLDDKPLIKNGSMYVNPVSIIEPLGGRVGGYTTKLYKNCILNEKVIFLFRDDRTSKVIDNIDGCIKVNNTVYVPLRKLVKIFGLKLKWDAKTKTATISM
jgi:hypothetical protein